jgi:hypothetical protein
MHSIPMIDSNELFHRDVFEQRSQLEFKSVSVLFDKTIAQNVSRLSKAQRGISLVAEAVSRQRECLIEKERVVKVKEEALRAMEMRLAADEVSCTGVRHDVQTISSHLTDIDRHCGISRPLLRETLLVVNTELLP